MGIQPSNSNSLPSEPIGDISDALSHFQKRFVVSAHPLDPSQSTLFLLHERLSQHKFILRLINTNDQEDSNKLQAQVCKKLANKPDGHTLVPLDHYMIQHDKSYCNEIFHCYLLFKIEDKSTLSQWLTYNQANHIHTHQEVIINGLNSLVQAVSWLKFYGHPHPNINTNAIYINKNNQFSLGDPWMMIDPQTKYPSPEKLKKINNQIDAYDPYLANLFSIGVLGLEMLGIPQLQKLYKRNYRIDVDRLHNYINSIRNQPLRAIIAKLLSNPQQRAQLIQQRKTSTKTHKPKVKNLIPKQLSNKMAAIRQSCLSQSQSIVTRKEVTSKPNTVGTIQPMNQPTIQATDANDQPMIDDDPLRHIKNKPQPVLRPYNNRVNFGVKNQVSFNKHPPPQSFYSPTTFFKPQPQNTFDRTPTSYSLNPPSSLVVKSSVQTEKLLKSPVLPKQYQPATTSFRDTQSLRPQHTYKTQIQNQLKQLQKKVSQAINNTSSINSQEIKYPTNVTNSILIHDHKKQPEDHKIYSIDSPAYQEKIEEKQQKPQKKQQQPIKKQQQFIKKQQEPMKKQHHENQESLDYLDINTTPKASQKQVEEQQQFQTPIVPSKSVSKLQSLNNLTIPQQSDQESLNGSLTKPKGQWVEEIYDNGGKYQGYMKNGKRNGEGVFYYRDGGYYDGHWKDNMMNGHGKLYYDNGKVAYEGQWYRDQFHGRGKVYNDSPEPIEGHFDYKDLSDTEMYWVFYEGDLVHDMKIGYGRMMFSNGEYFEGEYKNDTIHGKGSFHRVDGKVVRGLWEKGILVKETSN